MSARLTAACFTVVYCAAGTAVIAFVIDKAIGLRVTPEDEIMGLDLTQHFERAYTMLE